MPDRLAARTVAISCSAQADAPDREARLREALDDAQHQLESIAEAVVSLGTDWCVTYANSQALRGAGLPAEKLIGRNVWTCFPGAEQTRFYAELHRALHTQTSVVVEDEYGPRRFRMKAMPHRKGLTVLVSDVTKRRRAEAALRAAEERARLLVQHLSDVICVMEPEGTLTYLSPACERLLGAPAEAWQGQNLFACVHPDDLLDAVAVIECCAAQPGARPPSFDFRWRRPDGSFVVLEAIAHNLLHEPVLQALVVTVRDATERHRAIAALEQSLEKERQVNELRAGFVAVASHEFRTPLATILSSADLAERFLDRSREKTEKHLQRIKLTVRDMLSLLDSILELERVGAEELRTEVQRLDLPAFADELLEELRIGIAAEHTLRRTGEAPALIEIDRVSLRLVLSNLLVNAVKYSAPGSTVTLDVSRPEPGAPVVVFRISDTGIGIPKAEQPLLFEPFHRATNVGSVKGTGLGLSMVKQTVEYSGGTISLQSEAGVGTTFEVMLPLRARNAARPDASPAR